MKLRLLPALALVAAGVGSTIVSATSDVEATGGTFDCDPGFYQVIKGQFAEFDPSSGVYTPIGADDSNYNAMGHRPADGYIYGIRGKTLLRIDDSGTATPLGQLNVVSGAYTGDFGDDGLLHISRGGQDWYKVDVDTLTATRVDALSVGRSVADIANISGKFYGVSSTGVLWRFDPVAETSTNLGTVGGVSTASKAFGAAWTTAGNNFYVGRNSGEIYQITGFSTGNPVATQVLSSPVTNSNDGAACPYAPPAPGIPDIDGPLPEVAPTTPEGQAAAEEYEDEYVEPEFVLPDAGIGTGASCEASPDVARPERESVVSQAVVAPTEIYANSFDNNASDFYVTSGSWAVENDAYRQLNLCGFDGSALLRDELVDHFDLEVSFHAVTGVNQGGVVFHQSSVYTRSGATFVDLSDDGETLRWGYYDDAGYYQNQGWDFIPAPETGQSVTLKVEVRGNQYTVIYNGTTVITETSPHAGGMVGLVATQSDVAFDSISLTAVPVT